MRVPSLAVCLVAFTLACGQADPPDPLLGTWETELNGGRVVVTFEPDGSFRHRMRAMAISNGDLLGHWVRREGALELTLDAFEGPFAHYFEPGVSTTWRLESIDGGSLVVEAADGEWFGFRPNGSVVARFRRSPPGA